MAESDYATFKRVIELINAQKPTAEMILEALGTPPWDKAKLERFYFENFEATREALKSHPGAGLHDRLENVVKARRLFNEEAEELLKLVEELCGFLKKPDAHYPDRKGELSLLEWQLQKQFYRVTSAAKTLDDLGFILKKKLAQFAEQQYDDVWQSVFDTEEQEFFFALRHSFTHARLPEPNWQSTIEWYDSGRVMTTCVLLNAEDLLNPRKWSVNAKAYAKKHQTVDIGKLVSSYKAKVNEFKEWLVSFIENIGCGDLEDYRKCELVLRRVTHRTSYKLLLQLTKPGVTNPYQHLGSFLTREQIKEVEKLPTGSKEQVDLIIQLADPEEAVDDEIRANVYELFGVIE